METQISQIPTHSLRVRPGAGRWLRAGVCATGIWLSALPVLAQVRAAPVNADAVPSVPAQSSGDPVPLGGSALPNEPPSSAVGDPTLPREPNPTGIELPDEVTVGEMKGAFGLGLGLLILGGIITAGAVIALLTLLVQRTWSGQT